MVNAVQELSKSDASAPPRWFAQVVEAYGGQQRWRDLKRFELDAKLTGMLFRLKRWGRVPPPSLRVAGEVHRPHVRLSPIDGRDLTMVVDGRDSRLERGGQVVDEVKDLYGKMTAGRYSWHWDLLAMGYFL